MVTLILMLMMCVLLFFMIWAATYFYPRTGLLTFFPNDIEEKARQHKPPFPTAPGTTALAIIGKSSSSKS